MKKPPRIEKSRQYLEELLDKAGATDEALATAIAQGMKSDNSTERSKALELAATWRGFSDVDKKSGEDIEHLPISNISLQDLDRMANRCAYCKHQKFEALKKGHTHTTDKVIEQKPVLPTLDQTDQNGPVVPTDAATEMPQTHLSDTPIEQNEPTA